jgi:hypothetical protein
MVADPDQQALLSGALRFDLSLRATGDGSLSFIVFRGHHPRRSPIAVMATTTGACGIWLSSTILFALITYLNRSAVEAYLVKL